MPSSNALADGKGTDWKGTTSSFEPALSKRSASKGAVSPPRDCGLQPLRVSLVGGPSLRHAQGGLFAFLAKDRDSGTASETLA